MFANISSNQADLTSHVICLRRRRHHTRRRRQITIHHATFQATEQRSAALHHPPEYYLPFSPKMKPNQERCLQLWSTIARPTATTPRQSLLQSQLRVQHLPHPRALPNVHENILSIRRRRCTSIIIIHPI